MHRMLVTVTCVSFLAGSAWAGPAAPPPSGAPDRSQVRLSLGERVLLDWLKASTPYTVTVNAQLFTTDLVFSEPSDLVLGNSKATFKVRVRGRTIPVDQVLAPSVSVRFDAKTGKYFVVVQSLPLQMPGMGRIDLKEFIPDWPLPATVEDFWRFSDRPIGLNLSIRRVAIVEHAVEIGADVTFAQVNPSGTRTGS